MKRAIPPIVWQYIQPIINQYRRLIIPVTNGEHVLFLKDADPESVFYYQCDPIADTGRFKVEMKPLSIHSVQTVSQELSLNEMIERLKQWFEALDAFDKTETIYDDPIVKGYEQEFASYFVMNEADEFESMDYVGQRYLLSYLDRITEQIEEQRPLVTEKKAEQLTLLLAETEVLKEDLPELSKNQTVRRLINIWAKTRKVSVKLITDLLSDFKKEGLKLLAKGILDAGSDSVIAFWNSF